jgi:hypothetical protein
MGCGCVALVVGAVLAILFFIYASTDPGPPIETVAAGAALLGASVLAHRAPRAGVR